MSLLRQIDEARNTYALGMAALDLCYSFFRNRHRTQRMRDDETVPGAVEGEMSRLQREMDLARAEYMRWFAAWTNPALSESMRQEARERAQAAYRQMQKIDRLQRAAATGRAHSPADQLTTRRTTI